MPSSVAYLEICKGGAHEVHFKCTFYFQRCSTFSMKYFFTLNISTKNFHLQNWAGASHLNTPLAITLQKHNLVKY